MFISKEAAYSIRIILTRTHEKRSHTLQVNPLVPGHCVDIAQLHSCSRCFQDSEAQSAFHTKTREVHQQYK